MELIEKKKELEKLVNKAAEFLIEDEWYEAEKYINKIEKMFGDIAISIVNKPVNDENDVMLNNYVVNLLKAILNAKIEKDSVQMADLLQYDVMQIFENK